MTNSQLLFLAHTLWYSIYCSSLIAVSYLLLPVASTRPALVITMDALVPQHTDIGTHPDGKGTWFTLE